MSTYRPQENPAGRTGRGKFFQVQSCHVATDEIWALNYRVIMTSLTDYSGSAFRVLPTSSLSMFDIQSSAQLVDPNSS